MSINFHEEYLKITKGYTQPLYQYTTPEEQGLAIKKCTILEGADICYSTGTTMDSNKNKQGN